MLNILKKIGWFIKEEKRVYIFMLIMLLAISAISLAPAKALGLAIDTIVSILSPNRVIKVAVSSFV